jgi:hypothetical protein
MRACGSTHQPTSLQRGLRSSFPNHILGGPMASVEMFGRFRWLGSESKLERYTNDGEDEVQEHTGKGKVHARCSRGSWLRQSLNQI